MHLSDLADALPTPDSRLEKRDGGRSRPVRALIVTMAVALAGLAVCEAVSPGLLTHTLARVAA